MPPPLLWADNAASLVLVTAGSLAECRGLVLDDLVHVLHRQHRRAVRHTKGQRGRWSTLCGDGQVEGPHLLLPDTFLFYVKVFRPD